MSLSSHSWFSTVNLGLTAYATGCLIERWQSGLGSRLPVTPLAILAGTLLYFLLNTGMVSVAVALSQRAGLWSTWRKAYLWTAPSYLAGAVVVGVAGSLQHRFGAPVASLSPGTRVAGGCLYLVYHSYRCYLDRLHQLQASEERLQAVCLAAVESLALAISAKDGVTDSHPRRVQQIALALAEQAGVTPAERQAIWVGSLTHDVGKLAVPDTILSKAGRLSAAEFERVKTHVAAGVRILEPVQFPWPVVEVVRTHHERWDGAGYPAGLKGEEIPLGGRIVALADVFDALTSPRPHRAPLTCTEALNVIRCGSGTQFDPRLVELFSTILPELIASWSVARSETIPAGTGQVGISAAARPAGEAQAAGSVWEQIRGASQETLSVAFTDPLTGLGNARYLASALPCELETALRHERPLAVLLMDLDGFKAINDHHGHLRGDAALQRVARILREALREGATVCRYAGDEFVVLLPSLTRDQAERIAERLSTLVDVCALPDTRLRLGLSIGIASFPEDGMDTETLLNAADQNMYADKTRRKAAPLQQIA